MALAVAAVTVLSGNANLKLGWVAFSADHLTGWLVGFALTGFLCVLLAIAGQLRILLFLFALVVVILLVKGFFYGFGYSFENSGQVKNALILIGGAFVAFLGAWPTSAPRRRSAR